MRCTYCGTSLPDGALFCGECGRPVTPAAAAAVPAHRRVQLPVTTPAPVSPEPLREPEGVVELSVLRCEQCGATLGADEIFCGECGTVSQAAARQFSQSRDTVALARIEAESLLSAGPASDETSSNADSRANAESRPGIGEFGAINEADAVDEAPHGTAREVAEVENSSPEESIESTPSQVPPQAVPRPRLTLAPFDESDDMEATRISRPRLGERFVLQFSTGESSTVHGNGLIGRNPVSEPGEYFDQVVRVIDPSRSVSKTHLEFGQEGGSFWVMDRYSGNGTIVREPEADAVRCKPDRRYRVARGTRVDIGEQFFVVS